MANRRREHRVKAERSEGMLRGSIPVTIVDLSRSGFRLQMHTRVRPGTSCELRANLDGIRLSAQVLITRCTASGAVPDGVGGRTMLYTAGASIVRVDGTESHELSSRLEGVSDVGLTADARGLAGGEEAMAPYMRLLPKLARDAMSPSVVTIRDIQPLDDLVRLLHERHFSGAAVVNGAGTLVGLVTARHLVAQPGGGTELQTRRKVRKAREKAESRQKPEVGEPHRETRLVRDIMTDATSSTIAHDTPLEEVADAMIARGMNRLLVVRDGKPVGVVDAVDLLALGKRTTAHAYIEEIELVVD